MKLPQFLIQVPGVEEMVLHMDRAPIPTAHHTLYWCKIFAVENRSKVHLVGVSENFSNIDTNATISLQVTLNLFDGKTVF